MPRNLVLVLGDQLDRRSAAFDGFDPGHDSVWMAEVAEESTHVWAAKPRIALFLSAMRHFRDRLRAEGIAIDYRELPVTVRPDEPDSLAAALRETVGDAATPPRGTRPQRLVVVEPGEYRVRELLVAAAERAGIPLEIRPDRHFFGTVDDFAAHARGRISGSYLFVGPPGVGKTHLAVALGRAAVEAGHSVLFTSAIIIINLQYTNSVYTAPNHRT